MFFFCILGSFGFFRGRFLEDNILSNFVFTLKGLG